MTERVFPEAFEELRAFLAYEAKDDGGFRLWGLESQHWVKGKHWKERPKHTLAELRAALDERKDWHLAFFPDGMPYAVLDFDFKKLDALIDSLSDEDRLRLGPKVDASRAMMDDWLAELQEYTYVATSKSRNGYHAILEYPWNRRRIETGEGHPLDLLGAGFVVLTGWSCGHNVIAKPWPDHATSIQFHWPDDGREAAGLGEVWFGGRKLTLHEPPLDEAELIGIDEVRGRLLRLNPRYAWHLHGAADAYAPSPDQRRHQPRMDMLQGLALVTYGMAGASEIIWEVACSAWFATHHTPAASNSNKDRFENRSKVRWIKQREIPIAIALAHQQRVSEKEQADSARELVSGLAARPPGPRADFDPPLDTFLLCQIERVFVSSLAIPNLDEVAGTLPFWSRLNVVLFNGILASSVLKPYGGSCTPSFFLIGGTGEGKATPGAFFLSIMGTFSGVPKKFDIRSSATSGAAFRDNLEDGRLIFLTLEEGKEFLVKAAAASASAAGDNSIQSYLPNALAGQPTAGNMRAAINRGFETKPVNNPLLAMLLSIQPEFVQEAVNDPKVSALSLVTGGIFGRMVAVEAPAKGEFDPDIYIGRDVYFRPESAFLRHLVRAADKTDFPKAIETGETNTAAFKQWLFSDLPRMGLADKAKNRLRQLSLVYAIQHAFARSVTQGHYEQFCKLYAPRSQGIMQADGTLTYPHRQGDILEQGPDLISFYPAKPGVQQVHIELHTALTDADHAYGKAIITAHARCLTRVFRDDFAPQIAPTLLEEVLMLKLRRAIEDDADAERPLGTVSKRTVTRAAGMGQGVAQKVSGDEVVAFLDRISAAGVITRKDKRSFTYTDATIAHINAYLDDHARNDKTSK